MLCDVAVHAALLGWGAYLRARASLLDVWRERAVRAEREQQKRVDEARLAERTTSGMSAKVGRSGATTGFPMATYSYTLTGLVARVIASTRQGMMATSVWAR